MKEDRNFMKMLKNQWSLGKFVSVGLDTEVTKIPNSVSAPNIKGKIVSFNKAIIDSTKDIACVYKPNIAFYEAHGSTGLTALQMTIAYISKVAPNVPVILDAKRADIGNTNFGYVQEAFDYLKADAITLHPYLGQESLKPFLSLKNKGCIILCRTSPPGSGEFQDKIVDNMPLYQYVANQTFNYWNKNGNCLLVIGATCPEELHQVRESVDDMPILIPGIGAQGGDLEKSVVFGKDSNNEGIIINSSRGIIFASNGPDFADVARQETQKLNDLINQYRQL